MEENKRLLCNVEVSEQSPINESEPDSSTAENEVGQEQRTGLVSCVVAISLVVSVGGVIGGYSHGFPSPTLLDLQEDHDAGERVSAFSSKSIYAGIFGVSIHAAPPTSHPQEPSFKMHPIHPRAQEPLNLKTGPSPRAFE